jgi:hypothetical protein
MLSSRARSSFQLERSKQAAALVLREHALLWLLSYQTKCKSIRAQVCETYSQGPDRRGLSLVVPLQECHGRPLGSLGQCGHAALVEVTQKRCTRNDELTTKLTKLEGIGL